MKGPVGHRRGLLPSVNYQKANKMPKKSQNAWGGTTGQAAGRLLIALIFFASAFGKFSSFDKHTGGPQMPYLSAKLDGAKAHIQALTGFHVPIEKVRVATAR